MRASLLLSVAHQDRTALLGVADLHEESGEDDLAWAYRTIYASGRTPLFFQRAWVWRHGCGCTYKSVLGDGPCLYGYSHTKASHVIGGQLFDMMSEFSDRYFDTGDGTYLLFDSPADAYAYLAETIITMEKK